MRVILLSDQRNLGKRGHEVDVKPGYARNFLIPQGMVLEATNANKAYFSHQKKKIDDRHSRERDAAAAVAEQLASIKIEIAKRVGENEVLYGSVTAADVAAVLEAKGVTIDKRRIDLAGGIKKLGDHTVRVDLHPEVVAELVVSVIPER
ncbi:MAG TPA: 50S ribosomal protein L9 [Thermoanaerobaculia bacterium]|jgi:large subunit ribosomal protein L9|nr:50S ribosomal protein L9 [Thermoanaerobaculia bacterium]